jgi:hypothetical protein
VRHRAEKRKEKKRKEKENRRIARKLVERVIARASSHRIYLCFDINVTNRNPDIY